MRQLRAEIRTVQSPISGFTSKCKWVHISSNTFVPADSSDQTSNVSAPATDTESWLQDLELMHHYSHRTSRTHLGAKVRLQHVWQEHVPSEAIKHPFLMHGVLALAALHIACMRPKQAAHYASLCDKHQASALASYRQILTHITDDVADALFALSTILSISSVARGTLRASQMEGPQYISVESICELLFLTRGVREVKEATGELVSKGPFSVVLFGHDVSADVQVTMSPRLMSVFRELERMIHDHCIDIDQRKHCSEALTFLHSVYLSMLAKYALGGLEMGHVWRWTAMLSYDFIRMVQAEYPPALVITAHFTVAAMMLRDMWFMNTWGKYALDGIRIGLKGQLEEYLVWPEEQMASDNAGLKYGAATIETAGGFQEELLASGSYVPSPMIQTSLAE
jgi:hypothetical protein